MLFMIIERFRDNDMLPVYRRVRDEGRMIPEGLKYVESWVEPNVGRCFLLMECDDLRRLQEWVLQWTGSCVTFEIATSPRPVSSALRPSSGRAGFRSSVPPRRGGP